MLLFFRAKRNGGKGTRNADMGIMSMMKVAFILAHDQVEYKTEQNINFIDVNCTVSCQIHEYNITANSQMVIIDDLPTKS